MLIFKSEIASQKSQIKNQKSNNINKGMQNQTFNKLFLKSTGSVNQNNLPQKMSMENLLKMISEDKLEVFINHENQMINVTKFFKSNLMSEDLGFMSKDFENSNLIENLGQKKDVLVKIDEGSRNAFAQFSTHKSNLTNYILQKIEVEVSGEQKNGKISELTPPTPPINVGGKFSAINVEGELSDINVEGEFSDKNIEGEFSDINLGGDGEKIKNTLIDNQQIASNELDITIDNSKIGIMNRKISIDDMEIAIDNPETMIETPEIAIDNPEAMIENPEIAIGNPETMIEDQEIAIVNPETMIENQEITIDDPETMIETPEIAIDNPETMIEDQEITIDNPETMIEDQEITIDNPEIVIENQDIAINIDEIDIENPEILDNDIEMNKINPEIKDEFLSMIRPDIVQYPNGSETIIKNKNVEEIENDIDNEYYQKISHNQPIFIKSTTANIETSGGNSEIKIMKSQNMKISSENLNNISESNILGQNTLSRNNNPQPVSEPARMLNIDPQILSNQPRIQKTDHQILFPKFQTVNEKPKTRSSELIFKKPESIKSYHETSNLNMKSNSTNLQSNISDSMSKIHNQDISNQNSVSRNLNKGQNAVFRNNNQLTQTPNIEASLKSQEQIVSNIDFRGAPRGIESQTNIFSTPPNKENQTKKTMSFEVNERGKNGLQNLNNSKQKSSAMKNNRDTAKTYSPQIKQPSLESISENTIKGNINPKIVYPKTGENQINQVNNNLDNIIDLNEQGLPLQNVVTYSINTNFSQENNDQVEMIPTVSKKTININNIEIGSDNEENISVLKSEGNEYREKASIFDGNLAQTTTKKNENIIDNSGETEHLSNKKNQLAQTLHVNNENKSIEGDEMAKNKKHQNMKVQTETTTFKHQDQIDRETEVSSLNDASNLEVSDVQYVPKDISDIHAFNRTPEELFKTHLINEQPFIVNFKNEFGQDVFQQIVIEKEIKKNDNRFVNVDHKFEGRFGNEQRFVNQEKINVSETATTKSVNSEVKKSVETTSAQNDNSNNNSHNNQNNQSFQDFHNSFTQNGGQVQYSSQSRGNSAMFDVFNQQIISKALEFSKTQQYEVKSMFDVMTLNLGKINVQIEKQGTTLRIDLKVETKDKESSVKENVQELTSHLKQFGFEQIDVNIDLDSNSKENSQSSQESRDNKSTVNQTENSTEQNQETFEKDRNFGYNSFEYTA